MKFYDENADNAVASPDAGSPSIENGQEFLDEVTHDGSDDGDDEDEKQGVAERVREFAKSDKGRLCIIAGIIILILLLLGGTAAVYFYNQNHRAASEEDFISKGSREVAEQVGVYLDKNWSDMDAGIKAKIQQTASAIFGQLMQDGFDYTDEAGTKQIIYSMLDSALTDTLRDAGYSDSNISEIFNNVSDIIWNTLLKYSPVAQGAKEVADKVNDYLDQNWPDMPQDAKDKVSSASSSIFEYIMNNGFDPSDEAGTKEKIMQMLKDMLYEYLKELGYTDEEINKMFSDITDLIWEVLKKQEVHYDVEHGTDGKDGINGSPGDPLTASTLIKTVNNMTEKEKETFTELLGISKEELEKLLEQLKSGTSTDILKLIEGLSKEELEKLLELLGIDSSELQRQIDELLKMIEDLNTDNESNFSEVNNNIENITNEMNSKHEEVMNKYEELNQELNNKYEELNSTIQSNVAELNQKIESTANSLTELINGNTKEIENVRQELSDTRDELEDLMYQLNEETNEYFQYLCDNLNMTIESLANAQEQDIANMKDMLIKTRDLLGDLINNDFAILKAMVTNSTEMLKNQIDSNWNAVLSMMQDQYEWGYDEDGQTMLTITTPVVPDAPAWGEFPNPDAAEDPEWPDFEKSEWDNYYE